MKRLRVLFCLDNMDIGGTEMNAVRTAERLNRDRFDLRVLALRADGPLRERYEAAGIPVVEFPIGSLTSRRAVAQGWRLLQMLRRDQIDIVHAHDVYTNIFAIPWARVAGTPLVIASRRWLTVVNRQAHQAANRLSYRFAHVVLANSEAVGRMVMDEEGVPDNKVAIIPNFVDDDAFAPLAPDARNLLRHEWGVLPDSLTVGIVANLHRVKEHHVLIRAVAKIAAVHPRLRVVLVGDGVCREELQALAVELGVADRVCFAGRRAHFPGMQQVFDIAVLCSREEGFPNTVVEAMAAGRPVVATRVGGIVDAVVDGETGVLVPPSDPDALASALDRLLRDHGARERMGAAGGRRARERYHRNVVIAELEQLYAQRGNRRAVVS